MSTKVDRLFEVYDSTEEAIKSFHPHPELLLRHFIAISLKLVVSEIDSITMSAPTPG